MSRLQILRHRQIVVAGPDQRFLRIAAFFLSQGGHQVTTTVHLEEVFDLIGRHDADVAILDGNASPAAALRIADDIESHYPSVTTFVVADEPAAIDPKVRGKWRAVKRLVEDFDQAASLAAHGYHRE